MSISILIECDVPTCNAKVTAEGEDPKAITGVSADPAEFVIDQFCYLPKGWTESDYTSTCAEDLHFCPEHSENDLGVDADILRAGCK